MLVGTAASVRGELEAPARHCGVDEFLVVTPIADYEQRLRFYELLSDALAEI
ncbi:alkanesulfonate monooxygenase SsuD/methylene tetrahydromethanopterin reductase-like flavin-dependent oxidoreductase (luciferase family) [Bacillus sp. 3255]|nr:alkanesulfonate monooxygenase SsuD/methylene tetrahydromethanopterin reductase-like flavin-dependent oxidoreductase (luciferase family) [Bacillus sp. 3255]